MIEIAILCVFVTTVTMPLWLKIIGHEDTEAPRNINRITAIGDILENNGGKTIFLRLSKVYVYHIADKSSASPLLKRLALANLKHRAMVLKCLAWNCWENWLNLAHH